MNVTSPQSIYVPGEGWYGYLPGYEKPVARWGDEFWAQMREQAAQNAGNRTEREPSPNGPGRYDPEALESFERRKLTRDELKELAAELSKKYNPVRMSQRDLDSFMDDLVEAGVLSKDELGALGYHGLIVMGSLEDGTRFGGCTSADTSNPNWNTYFSRYGDARTLQETGGNALAYVMLQLLWSKDPAGSPAFVKHVETQRSAYTAMAEVLEAMQRV